MFTSGLPILKSNIFPTSNGRYRSLNGMESYLYRFYNGRYRVAFIKKVMEIVFLYRICLCSWPICIYLPLNVRRDVAGEFHYIDILGKYAKVGIIERASEFLSKRTCGLVSQ